MGEKVKKAKKNSENTVTCPYCSKRYDREEQVELGNIDKTIAGDVLWCPNAKCNQQSMI